VAATTITWPICRATWAIPAASPDRQLTLRLRTNLRLVDLAAVCKPERSWRGRLDKLLSESIEQLAAINESITQHYFSHADVSRRLASSVGRPRCE